MILLKLEGARVSFPGVFLKAMAMEGQTQEINVEVPEGMGPGQCPWQAIFLPQRFGQ